MNSRPLPSGASSPALPPVPRPAAGGIAAETDFLRYISDALELSTLCRRARCHRAQQCRSDPRHCTRRFQPLISEAIESWIHLVHECQRDGIELETTREDNEEEFEALAQWREAMWQVRTGRYR